MDAIAEQAKRVFRDSTNGQPMPDGWLPIEAWSDGRYVIILGTPIDDESLPEEEWHNCDAMGCSSVGNHVVGRFVLPASVELPTRRHWLAETLGV